MTYGQYAKAPDPIPNNRRTGDEEKPDVADQRGRNVRGRKLSVRDRPPSLNYGTLTKPLDSRPPLPEAEIPPLEQQVQLLEDEKHHYLQELEARYTEIHTLTQQVQLLEDEKHHYLQELEARYTEIHEMETRLTTYADSVQSLNQQAASSDTKIRSLQQQMQNDKQDFQKQMQLLNGEIDEQNRELATLRLVLMTPTEKSSLAKKLAKMYVEEGINQGLLVQAGKFFPHSFLDDIVRRFEQEFELAQKIDGNVVTIPFREGKLELIVDTPGFMATNNLKQARKSWFVKTDSPEKQDRFAVRERLEQNGLPTKLTPIQDALRLVKSNLTSFIFTVLGGRQTQTSQPRYNHDGLLEIAVITQRQGLLIYRQDTAAMFDGGSHLSTPTSPAIGKVLPGTYILGAKLGTNPINWFGKDFVIHLPPDQEKPIDMSTFI